jgi:hypothetical protein
VARLRLVASRFLGGSAERYEFLNPRVDFLGNNRLRFQVEVQEKDAQSLAIQLESGLSIIAGQSLQLIEPAVSINGKALSPQLVAGFSSGISNRYNLRTLEEAGITARLLQLDIDTGELKVAGFVRVEASNRASVPSTGEPRP